MTMPSGVAQGWHRHGDRAGDAGERKGRKIGNGAHRSDPLFQALGQARRVVQQGQHIGADKSEMGNTRFPQTRLLLSRIVPRASNEPAPARTSRRATSSASVSSGPSGFLRRADIARQSEEARQAKRVLRPESRHQRLQIGVAVASTKLFGVMTSNPPASKRFFANIARAVKSATRQDWPESPRAMPFRAASASARSRRASKGSASRIEGNGISTGLSFERSEHLDNRFLNFRKFADTGDGQAAGPDILQATIARIADHLGDESVAKRAAMPGLAVMFCVSMSWNSDHALVASSSVRASISARTGGGINRAVQVRFIGEDQAGVACEPPRRAIRQPESRREWQHLHQIRTAHTGREGRDGVAQQVHMRIAPSQHAPGGFRVQPDGPGREATGLFIRAIRRRIARNFAMVRNWSSSATSVNESIAELPPARGRARPVPRK